MRVRLIVAFVLVAGICCACPALTVATSIGPPGGFRLVAGNGYSIHGFAVDGDPRGERDGMLLFIERMGSGVAYFARKGVQVSDKTISAEIGNVASIDLQFVPSGGRKKETASCGGRPIEFDSGFYEGHFDFHGEEGFAEVHADRVRGEVRFEASLLCGAALDEGIGGHAPGARLQAQQRRGAQKIELEVTKNSPTRPTRFHAQIEERREGLAIIRAVVAKGGPDTFRCDVSAHAALLQPPDPFRGAAHLVGGGQQPIRLAGSLRVDFPGRASVALSGLRGGLVRWVQNPSHPFRFFVRKAHRATKSST